MRTDSLGNTYVTDDNGNQTSYRTDSLGNTYGSDGSMSRTDSLGNTYVTDGNGNQTQYRTDSLGGCKPEPPKFPSCQFHPFHKGIQVNHLAVTLKGIVSVQQNVSPGCRRYLGERRERLGVTCCFALR